MSPRRVLAATTQLAAVGLAVIAVVAVATERWLLAIAVLLMLVVRLLAEIATELAGIRAQLQQPRQMDVQVHVLPSDPGATAEEVEQWLRDQQ